MRHLLGASLLCASVGASASVSSAFAQDLNSPQASVTVAIEPPSAEQQAEAARKETIAESIVAREEAASGRAFDPAFRAAVKRSLVSLPLTTLESQTQRSGLGPYSLGESQVDLLYTPLTPCRIIDTRSAGGAIAAGTTRSFSVIGADLSAQGGSATGCNVPSGATAAVINFVAVNPAGPGDLRVTPFGTPMPLASIINYAAVTGLNIANGPVVGICNPATTTCTFDITVQADVSAVNLVADVQGYFRNINTEPFPRSTVVGVGIPPAGATPAQLTFVSFTAKSFGNVLVRARGYCNIGFGGPATDDEIDLGIGTNSTDAFNTAVNPVSQWGVVQIPMNSGYHQVMFSAERVWPTARGATYFLALFGRHSLGTNADDCSGSLVVERLF